MTMTAASVAVLLACVALVGQQIATLRAEAEREIRITTDVVAASAAAAIAVSDRASATHDVSALGADPRVVEVTLHDRKGGAIASWRRSAPVAGWRSVQVERPVVDGRNTIGRIVVRGDIGPTFDAVVGSLPALALIAVASLLATFGLAMRLPREVAAQVAGLAAVAGRAAVDRQYAVRAGRPAPRNDIDALAAHVDEIVQRLGERETEAERARRQLQQLQVEFDTRVQDRTRDLNDEIAAQVRTQAGLVAARQAAEAANRAKSAFLANMSHELRTPLNAIIGYSQMLMEDTLDTNPAANGDLRRIERAGQHLLSLINDVLDLSKIEAGRLVLRPAPVDGGELLAEVVATSRPLVEKNHNRFETEGLDQLGHFVADATRVRQVLLNLLSNGGKFTTRGEVRLRAARRHDGIAETVVFEVHDTGIGMSAEHLGRLFREFSQADDSTTEKYGGTGLGLAISQRLCEAMGGSISVVSAEGIGSTFTVTLPAAPAAYDSRRFGTQRDDSADERRSTAIG